MPLMHCSIIYKPILCLIVVLYLKEITGLRHLKYAQQLTFFLLVNKNTHAATVYPDNWNHILHEFMLKLLLGYFKYVKKFLLLGL